MAKKNKYYVVWQGHDPGIYSSWSSCQAQIKGYPNAKYKGFPSKEAAEEAFSDGYDAHVSVKKTVKKATVLLEDGPINWESISVDAACSGNPGIMEYQGVDTTSSDQLFHQRFSLGTNNIGEFLALVHGLAYLKQIKSNKPIYTDSRTALGWVRRKKCNTKLVRNAKTAALYKIILRAESWLKSNTYQTEILKWDTESWGEIPADFGRK